MTRSNDLNKLHPYCRECAERVLLKTAGEFVHEGKKYSVGVFEGLRTLAQQEEYLAKGVSKTLLSYHLLGLAVDFVFKDPRGSWTWAVPNHFWDKLGQFMQEEGFYSLWLGHGWDGPHGEIKVPGQTASSLFSLLEHSASTEDFYSKVSVLLDYFPEDLSPVTLSGSSSVSGLSSSSEAERPSLFSDEAWQELEEEAQGKEQEEEKEPQKEQTSGTAEKQKEKQSLIQLLVLTLRKLGRSLLLKLLSLFKGGKNT